MDPLNPIPNNTNPHVPPTIPHAPTVPPVTPPPPTPLSTPPPLPSSVTPSTPQPAPQPSPPRPVAPPPPQPKPPAPPAGGLTPPPPVPEIRLHTMVNDIASIEKSGGAEPQPQYITMIREDAPLPITNTAQELPPLENEGGRKKLMWLAALIIIVGFGLLIYTYSLPYFIRQSTTTTPALTQTPPPAAPEPVPQPPPPLPPAPAMSLFNTPLNTLPSISLTDNTLAFTLAALQAAAAKKPENGNMQEFKILDAKGAPLPFSTYLQIILPEAQSIGLAETLTAAFEDSFGAYFFYDDKGAWPGYVAKLKPSSNMDIVTLTDRLQKLEASSYGNFFLAQPGIPQEFKTGQALGKYPDRYIAFSAPGALFSYGLFENYLILNTSNEGLKQILAKLAL